MSDIAYCLKYIWCTQRFENWLIKWTVVLYGHIFLIFLHFKISGGNWGPMRDIINVRLVTDNYYTLETSAVLKFDLHHTVDDSKHDIIIMNQMSHIFRGSQLK
jgi:hypothetical protein